MSLEIDFYSTVPVAGAKEAFDALQDAGFREQVAKSEVIKLARNCRNVMGTENLAVLVADNNNHRLAVLGQIAEAGFQPYHEPTIWSVREVLGSV